MSINKKIIETESVAPIPPAPSSDAFNVITYTGNGSSTRSITGVGFKPDLVYLKERSSTSPPILFDSTRGVTKFLQTTSVNGQVTDSTTLKSFDSDGFTIGGGGEINQNGQTYVAWCWRANGGTTSSNTDGSVTGTIQVKADAGFSIIKYTGDGGGIGGTGTVGHGLGYTPRFVIGHAISNVTSWICYLSDGTDYWHGYLDGTSALAKNGSNTQIGTPNDTTIGLSHAGTNASGVEYMYWAWTPKSEYSKFGTYTGNGTASGNVVEPGFAPDFVIVKRTESGTSNWGIFDSKRGGTYYQKGLMANLNDAEYAETNVNSSCEFLAAGHAAAPNGGFRFRNSSSPYNASGVTYIYAAFKIIN